MDLDLNDFLSWAIQDGHANDFIAQLKDARQRPQIPTQHIGWLVVLGGVLRAGSLLQIEGLARRKEVRNFPGVQNSVLIASDSTMERVLAQLDGQAPRDWLYAECQEAWQTGEAGIWLDGRRYFAVGVDGTTFGKHPATVAVEMGTVPLLADLEPMSKGEELPTSKLLLKRLKDRLPELELVFSDGLYLNKPHLDFVTEDLKMAAIVKYTPKEGARLPDILQDLERLIHTTDKQDGIVEQVTFQGTDRRKHKRITVWCVRQMDNLGTIKPVDAAKIRIYDTKTRTAEVFYVVACGIHLSLEALVEAGRLRWQAENQGFKLFNALCASKHRYSSKPEIVEHLTLLLMAGHNLLVLFHHHFKGKLKKMFPGFKDSIKHLATLLKESVATLSVCLDTS